MTAVSCVRQTIKFRHGVLTRKNQDKKHPASNTNAAYAIAELKRMSKRRIHLLSVKLTYSASHWKVRRAYKNIFVRDDCELPLMNIDRRDRNGPTAAKYIAAYASTSNVRFQSLFPTFGEVGFEIFSGNKRDRGFKKKNRR
jgi:hypothetical protein